MVPLDGESLSGSALEVSGLPAAHILIPDKIFHPQHQPVIVYI